MLSEIITPQYPANQQRIIDAALECMSRWGVEKTSLNDIAKTAGVTRPTVYRYFPNKDEIVHTAMLQVGFHFAEKLYRHFNRFESPAERLLEAVMFAYKNLPKEPHLGLAIGGEMAQQTNERAIASKESHDIRLIVFSDILNNDPRYLPDVEELAEVSTRFLLSLLLVEGYKKRTPKEIKQLLERRLLPALGMSL